MRDKPGMFRTWTDCLFMFAMNVLRVRCGRHSHFA